MPIRDRVRSAIDWSVGSRAASRVLDRRWPGNVRVLAYHGVPSAPIFARHVEVIAAETSPITAGELAAAVLEGARLPDRPVLITFDDGDVTVRDNALPLLVSAGLPSVAFVITDLLGTDRPFWWSEVEELLHGGADAPAALPRSSAALVNHLKQIPDDERHEVIDDLRRTSAATPTQENLDPDDLRYMYDSGMEIGSHTRTHPCLDRCNPVAARAEVLGSADALEEILGARPALFAYPNGNVNRAARQAVQDAGHTLGFLFDHQMANTRQDPLRLSRLRINATDSVARLRAVLSGAHPRLHSARQSDLRSRISGRSR